MDADTAAGAMKTYSKELQRRAKGKPHTEVPLEVLPLVLDWAAALGAALARAPGRDAATTRVRCVPPRPSLNFSTTSRRLSGRVVGRST